MRAPLKKIFLARYVILAEVAGYVIAALLLGLWALFFFIHIDEQCYGSGPVKSAVLDIETPQKGVIQDVLAHDGEKVVKGQNILRLNLNDKAIAARQAQTDLASLGAQIVTLASDPSKQSALKTSLAQMVQEVGALPTGTQSEELRSPADGMLQMLLPSTTGTLTGQVVQGKLAHVISSKMLQVDAKLGEMNRDRVKVGQPVKIKVVLGSDQKIELRGSVFKTPAADQVVASAEITDPALATRLAADAKERVEAAEPLKAEVRVVVGNVKLITFLFPAKAPAKAGEKKDGMWVTVKKWWHKVF